MTRSSIRASRISGTPTTEFDRGGDLAPRAQVQYWCANDHVTTPTFASEAAPPEQWDCAACGGPAVQLRGTARPAGRESTFHRTPYEFLMMRRTEEDGERLLTEALAKLRSDNQR
ncbi:MAG: RNA polymerase-binding protein RbpA [Actinomycetes bacterium]